MESSVAATNDEATLCRMAAVNAGLLDNDPWVKLFVPGPERQVIKEPLINRGTAIRSWTLDSWLMDFIEHNDCCQILNLGCGFDTRCLRFHDRSIRFFEVDLPSVIRKKERVIQSSSLQLSDINAVLIAGDLYHFDALLEQLLELGLCSERPLIVLAECCFMYLTREALAKLINVLVCQFKVQFITFDAIQGNDTFGRTMRANLDNLPMPFFESCHSVSDYLDAFHPLIPLNSLDMLEAESLLPDDRQQLLAIKCPLDEQEEWRLIASHYVFARFATANE